MASKKDNLIQDIKSVEMFNTLLKNKNVIIDLYADWCGPCKRLTPLLEKLAVKYKETVVFSKLNIDHLENDDDMKSIDIELPETIPTILYYKNGKEIERLSTSDIKTIEENFILF